MILHENDVHFPDFDKIVEHCRITMRSKFFEYGNSWEQVMWSRQDWTTRLEGEFAELKKTTNVYEVMQELIDIINIASMWFERIKKK